MKINPDDAVCFLVRSPPAKIFSLEYSEIVACSNQTLKVPMDMNQ